MKITKNKYRILLVCFILSISLLLLLVSLAFNGIYLQIGTPGITYHFINCFLIFFILITGIYIIHHRFKDKGITLIAIVASSFISGFVLLYGLIILEAKYTTFSSPNKQENFVVIETGYGKVYQLSKTGLFMSHLTDIKTDDGYQPFSKGKYQLEWGKSNELVIKYVFDYMNTDNYEEVKIKYKSKID